MKPDKLLYQIQNPQHHTGLEINVVNSGFSFHKLNICLVFPDVYEIGMSHQGIKLLYHFLNAQPNINAERCFLPDRQSISIFKEHNTPLFSLESKTELFNFDLIAFSLLSELSFTNVLAVLDLAQIPLLASERNTNPLIAMGGISTINPEPLRNFADFFAFGDGEVLFPPIIDVLTTLKPICKQKEQILKRLDSLPGFYIPSLHLPVKQGSFYIPEMSGKTIKKQFIQTIDNQNEILKDTIVPLGQVVFDRLDIEVARGCPHACRFCQARNYYAPYRIKPGQAVLDQIETTLHATGFDTISLASLSTGDHPDLPEILNNINSVLPPCTSFSFPSLRPKTLTDQMLKTLSNYRRTGLTIVPEAGSERLRKVIGKEVTDSEIFSAVENAVNNGWQKIKLYFMIGLPTETDEDLSAIVALIKNILLKADSKRIKIELTISFSAFVPKPHTPFQWSPRLSVTDAQRSISLIKDALKHLHRIKLDFHSIEKGLVETILSRGDFRVGQLITDAFQAGEIFSAWDNSFHPNIWLELIEKHGLSHFTQNIPTNAVLPWSFIVINHTHAALLREYQAAILNHDLELCSNIDCSKCKSCYSFQDSGHFPAPPHISKISPIKSVKPSMPGKVRIFYKKKGDFRFFSHLSIQKYIERIIRISHLPFHYSEGFHPRIKMAMLPPLPVFAQSECECIELFLDNEITITDILRDLNTVRSPLKFYHATKLPIQSSSLMRDLKEMTFSFSGDITENQKEVFISNMIENESFRHEDGLFYWTLNAKPDISARFGITYRILDPEKLKTHCLTRVSLLFSSDISTEVKT